MNIELTLIQLVEWSLYVGVSCAICVALYESRHVKFDPKQPLQLITDLPQSFFYATGIFFLCSSGLAFLSGEIQMGGFMIFLAILQFWCSSLQRNDSTRRET